MLFGTSTLEAYRPLEPSRESRDSTELSHVPILVDKKIRGKSNEIQRKVSLVLIGLFQLSV